jgi:hypothetical protein
MAEIKAEGLTSFDEISAKYPGWKLHIDLDIFEDERVDDEFKDLLRSLFKEGFASMVDEKDVPVPKENAHLPPSKEKVGVKK